MHKYFLKNLAGLLGAPLSHEEPSRDKLRWLQHMYADAIRLLVRACFEVHLSEEPQSSLFGGSHGRVHIYHQPFYTIIYLASKYNSELMTGISENVLFSKTVTYSFPSVRNMVMKAVAIFSFCLLS